MSTNPQTEIRIKGLSHRYNSQWALRGVDFSLGGNGVVGLLGANGAGKSTLMNIICGTLTPTCGEVVIDGANLRRNPVEAKRRLGFLPQKPPLLPDLTVEEYLLHAARLRRVEHPAEAVDEVLERCGIAHFRRRLIKHLSGGYQQRAGIAQAIIHHPAFIVLDEPTNGLDPTQIVEIRKLIGRIARECLVMLSTHILTEVQLACDRILMLRSGELIYTGSMNDFNRLVAPCSLRVTLPGFTESERLAAIEGISHVARIEDEEGCFRLNFTGDSEAVCARVIAHCVGNGWPLCEIVREIPTADDIFKYLTTLPDTAGRTE